MILEHRTLYHPYICTGISSVYKRIKQASVKSPKFERTGRGGSIVIMSWQENIIFPCFGTYIEANDSIIVCMPALPMYQIVFSGETTFIAAMYQMIISCSIDGFP